MPWFLLQKEKGKWMKFLKLYPIEYLFSFGASDTWEWNFQREKRKKLKESEKIERPKTPQI
jgi:hypothetical protein